MSLLTALHHLGDLCDISIHIRIEIHSSLQIEDLSSCIPPTFHHLSIIQRTTLIRAQTFNYLAALLSTHAHTHTHTHTHTPLLCTILFFIYCNKLLTFHI